MVVDGVVAGLGGPWLGAAWKQFSVFAGAPWRLSRALLGQVVTGALPCFPDRLPIGVAAVGRCWRCLCRVMAASARRFRILGRHGALPRARPFWCVRLPRASAADEDEPGRRGDRAGDERDAELDLDAEQRGVLGVLGADGDGDDVPPLRGVGAERGVPEQGGGEPGTWHLLLAGAGADGGGIRRGGCGDLVGVHGRVGARGGGRTGGRGGRRGTSSRWTAACRKPS